MLRILRSVIGVLVLCSLTLFFLNVIDSFGILTKLQLIPSLFAANLLSILFLCIITLLLGRIYCSVPWGLCRILSFGFRERQVKINSVLPIARHGRNFVMLSSLLRPLPLLPALHYYLRHSIPTAYMDAQ